MSDEPKAPLPQLDRAAFLEGAATRPPRERVEIPELAGAVWVRGLTSSERDQFEGSNVRTDIIKGKVIPRVHHERMRARLLQQCLEDEDGNRLFEEADVAKLGKLRADVADRLFEVARRLSGITEADIEELKGNSSGENGA